MATNSGTIHVLHVDDEPDFAEMAAHFVEREAVNISVEPVTSVDAALDRLPGDFDCIVSDYDMPGQNGIEFLEQVRNDYGDVPFILFTGKGSEEVASEAISAGVSDYLQKGSGSERYSLLVNRIENLVSQYRAASELETRARQQRRIAELGQHALIAQDPQELFEEAVTILAETLGNEYAKVLELHPNEDELLLRAGVGWRDGLVGKATVGTGEDSQAGHTIRSEEPIVVTNLQTEDRFQGLPLLTEHDVTSGISVIIGSSAEPWGVLGTHSTAERSFSEDDITFVRNVSNVLANAIERHQAEQELRTSEERFRKMTELSPDAVFRLDKTGVIRYMSPAVERLLGHAPEEMISTSFDQYLSEDSLPAAFEGVKRTFNGEVVRELELTLIDVDGEEIQIEVSASPVRDDSGEIVRIQGMVRDISNRETREQQLHALQERTQQLMHTTTEAETGRVAIEAADDILGIQLAGFHVLNEAESTLEPVEILDSVRDELGEAPRYVRSDQTNPASRAIWAAFEAGEPLKIDDVSEYEDIAEITPARTSFVYPLGSSGVFIASATEPHAFDESDETYIDILAAALSSALERVERETQLETERDRFRTLFETLTVPVVELTYPDETPDPIVRAANPAFEDQFGYGEEELIDEPLDEYIVPAGEQPEATALNERALTGETSLGVEVLRETADGPRTFLLHSAVYPHQPGGFAIYTDITERKERERELERIQDFFTEAEQLGNLGAWEFDASGEIIWTEGTRRIHEVEESFEPTLEEGIAFYHPDDRDAVQEAVDDSLENGTSFDIEARLITAQDNDRWVRTRGKSIENPDSEVRIRGYIQDITDQKNRERELSKANSQLEAAVVAGNVATWEWHVPEDKLVAGPEFARKFGVDPDEAREGVPIGRYLPSIHEDDRERVGQHIQAALDSCGSYGEEYRVWNADDELRWVVARGHVECDDEGTPMRFPGALTDITARKQAEKELKRKNERLDEFTSIVSHDLQNPLAVAEGNLDLARSEVDSESLDAVERAHERMRSLIDDLLLIAREGESVDDLTWVDLDVLVEACWKNIETADATLRMNTAQSVRANEGRLKQLVENLISNAIKHAGSNVTITVANMEQGFYVEDDGPGIPPEHRDEVFEPGFTTASDGTGFGLVIVKRIAEAHGWDIRLAEKPEGGARFEVNGVEIDDGKTPLRS